ncbi:SDR family NAD(P)-dependent oxidoreductase [Candidatus Albibeggiatoa sp. nov. BB20]|uniref:SDR family NAD(P)-dependent oxidoreductase n=1 Tax=Candidatus Albibeggiatoa sp. nov. BB20 TaxID=3162723 RepID=UPI0033653126
MATILVTGVAGFIGSALAQRLLKRGDTVYGIDNLNDYYAVELKKARLARLTSSAQFHFQLLDITDRVAMHALFEQHQFDVVVNLAAQAGVRYSIDHPEFYFDTNLTGFGHILEGCRQTHVKHLVFASSSSVYGANVKQPFSESDSVDHPISLYAATKKANELMAHSYAHLYDLACTGLRFFTVYGPWMRPDMALFKFANLMTEGKAIPVYNHGEMVRDFTYIDDIIDGVEHVIDKPAQKDTDWNPLQPTPSSSQAPYRIYNIGCSRAVSLMYYIELLEKHLGIKAKLDLQPLQAGDVLKTFADTRLLQQDFDYSAITSVEYGVAQFAAWYKSFYPQS